MRDAERFTLRGVCHLPSMGTAHNHVKALREICSLTFRFVHSRSGIYSSLPSAHTPPTVIVPPASEVIVVKKIIEMRRPSLVRELSLWVSPTRGEPGAPPSIPPLTKSSLTLRNSLASLLVLLRPLALGPGGIERSYARLGHIGLCPSCSVEAFVIR